MADDNIDVAAQVMDKAMHALHSAERAVAQTVARNEKELETLHDLAVDGRKTEPYAASLLEVLEALDAWKRASNALLAAIATPGNDQGPR